MKRPYTQFHSLLKKMMKETGKSEDELIDDFRSCNWSEFQNRVGVDALRGDWAVSEMAMRLEGEVIHQRCTHVFLPGLEFCEWITSCVGVLEPDHCVVFNQVFGRKPVVLNFPTASHLKSVAVAVIQNYPVIVNGESCLKTALLISPSCEQFLNIPDTEGDACAWLAIIDGQDSTKVRGTAEFVCKLVVGVGMYCDCFPETIKDGPPEDLKHPAHHRYETVKTVSISAKILPVGSHDSPVSHYRRGHFRVLRSEKFTHKRFQTVFVRQTFVNGKSKTVLSPEEVTA